MKKQLKIAVGLITLFVVSEIFCYSYLSAKFNSVYETKFGGHAQKYFSKLYDFSDYYTEKYATGDYLTPVNNSETDKNAVLIFSDGSDSAEIKSGVKEYTKKPVYLFAIPGGGIQYMYYILKNDENLKNIDVERILYLYDSKQTHALSSFSFNPKSPFLNLRYKLKNGELAEKKPLLPFLYHSYTFKTIEKFFGWRDSSSTNMYKTERNYKLLYKLIDEAYNAAKEQYPSLKDFEIIRTVEYWDKIDNLEAYGQSESASYIKFSAWEKLAEDGIKLVDTDKEGFIDTVKKEIAD